MINNVIKIGMKKAIKAISRRSPMILAGVGVVGFIASTVVACKLTRKVDQVIQEKEEVKGESLTKKEKILAKAKVYLPTILLIIASTLCIGGSTFISHKRNLALSAALISSQEALKEYKEATIETVGEEVANDINKKTVEKKMEKSYEPQKSYNIEPAIIETGKGSDVIYDPLSDRYFTGSHISVDQAVNQLNSDLLDGEWAYVNDFYNYLGLNNVGLGDSHGWNYEFRGLITIHLEPVEAPWGQPIFTLKYGAEPIYDARWD